MRTVICFVGVKVLQRRKAWLVKGGVKGETAEGKGDGEALGNRGQMERGVPSSRAGLATRDF